jgi:hypothetical protein
MDLKKFQETLLDKTREAQLDSRNLGDWCDYKPAHSPAEYVALTGGKIFGQSCLEHTGALLMDAIRTDPEARLELRHADRDLSPVSIS